jgi:hypothetical protein
MPTDRPHLAATPAATLSLAQEAEDEPDAVVRPLPRVPRRPKRRRIALFEHLPRLRWREAEGEDGTDPVLGDRFPAAMEAEHAADLAVLRTHLVPHFVDEDREALRAQNDFRLDQLVLIAGGVAATGLGALSGVAHGTGWKVLAAAWTAFLAAWASRSRDLSGHERWRTCRLRAELLRSEYFLFLARARPYDDDACRVRNLKRRVGEIRSGGAA